MYFRLLKPALSTQAFTKHQFEDRLSALMGLVVSSSPSQISNSPGRFLHHRGIRVAGLRINYQPFEAHLSVDKELLLCKAASLCVLISSYKLLPSLCLEL